MRKLLFLGLAILLVSWSRADDDEGEKKKDKESIGTVIGIDLGTTYSWWVAALSDSLVGKFWGRSINSEELRDD